MNPLVLVQMVYWIGICRNWRLSGVLEVFLSSVCSVVECTVFLGDTAAVRPVPSPPCFFSLHVLGEKVHLSGATGLTD